MDHFLVDPVRMLMSCNKLGVIDMVEVQLLLRVDLPMAKIRYL